MLSVISHKKEFITSLRQGFGLEASASKDNALISIVEEFSISGDVSSLDEFSKNTANSIKEYTILVFINDTLSKYSASRSYADKKYDSMFSSIYCAYKEKCVSADKKYGEICASAFNDYEAECKAAEKSSSYERICKTAHEKYKEICVSAYNDYDATCEVEEQDRECSFIAACVSTEKEYKDACDFADEEYKIKRNTAYKEYNFNVFCIHEIYNEFNEN